MAYFPMRLEHGSGVVLERDASRLLLTFSTDTDLEKVAATVADFGLRPESSAPDARKDARQFERINNTMRRYWMRSSEGGAVRDDRIDALRETLGDQLDWVGPVYRNPDSVELRAYLCPLPNVLVVRERRGEAENTRAQPAAARAAASAGADIGEDRTKSRHLPGFRYFLIKNHKEMNAYRVREALREKDPQALADLRFETMPMIVPSAVIPNDTLFGQQWDMVQIDAPEAWDISTGAASTVICILDEGCDLTHPDLTFSGTGINLGTMSGDGSPTGSHGTACAGIAAASFNNATGVAGVAGGCEILPAAFDAWTDVEVAAGINYARTNGAHVISMSFGWNPWDPAIIDPAILDAFNAGLVMCVATHNHDAAITYPATNPLVIACGASDMADDRKSPTSPDGECWGSNFGPEISVVAPGVVCPSTDIQGADGYNADGSGGSGPVSIIPASAMRQAIT
jgi:hypothetical protein